MFKKSYRLGFLFGLCIFLAVIVAFGQTAEEVDLSAGEENVRILGIDALDWSAYSVSSGDINGDGYDDVIIGAYQADPATGREEAGEVYVIFGGASMPATIDLNSVSANMTIYGDNANDVLGCSVYSGNINGDDYDDIIIGAWGTGPQGKAYVIFGSATPPSTINLNTTAASMTIYGADLAGNFGTSVSSGDINGDGYDDIIIGDDRVEPATGRDNAGCTYVIFGSASPSTSINLNTSPSSADMTIYGDDNGDYSGKAVSSGDINGDGYDDVIIAAYTADPATGRGNAGETYVIFGSAAPSSTIDLDSTSAGMTIYGDDASDYLGNSVSSGDINNDGFDDLILGAHGGDPATGRENAGETYVIFGSTAPSATINLANSPSPADMIIYGDDNGDWSAESVSSGDINGDGYDDVIIGAYVADPATGRESAGEAYVIYGSAAPSATINLADSPSPANMIIYGDDNGDYLGHAVSSGDINGDGFDDLILSAYGADPTTARDRAGETNIVFGDALPIDYDFTTTDISDWDKMGTGNAILKNGELLMKLTTNYLRLFPKGAVADICDIEAKVKYKLGSASTAKSSIFFGYQDRRNYWELRIQFAGSSGKWILQRKASGLIEKHIYNDTINRGQQYHIKIEVRADSIKIYVDSVEKMGIFVTETPASGNVALEYRGTGKCLFDDVKVY